ncbi:MipA/OmpV family protein [Acidocella sp.]|uniref:MipA/OmpV family protein n=1 Tax=Acidocella sp. TaxID=50710 RepID=UPI002613C443|nr:MipA/OmpV family protein [Acidocella sp.]
MGRHFITLRNRAGRGWFFLGAALLMMTMIRPAMAQTPSPLAEWQYSSGIQLQRLFEPKIPTWQVELGLGTQFGPAADGLGVYKVQGGPAIDVRYKDIAFISSGEGIGANLFSFRHISVGAAITFDMGRSPHVDGAALNGLGTIHPAPELKFFATTVLTESFPLTIRVDIRKQFGASFGYVGDIGAYLPMPGSSAKFAWFLGPTVTLADTRYMNTYFGVSHNQAASSRYHYYKAKGGFKSAGLGLDADYFVTPHAILNVSAAFDRLLGSAADSPITASPYEGVVSLSAIYKF